MSAGDPILGLKLRALEPASFGRLVERLLWHLGFNDVSNIDGSGDGGADLVATRGADRWVCQCKWKKSGNVDVDAVEELRRGLQIYDASRGAVVTTTSFTAKAQERVRQLKSATGIDFGLWGERRPIVAWSADGAPKLTPGS